jgi:diketogulonate reductase-like aldo/keto reductase
LIDEKSFECSTTRTESRIQEYVDAAQVPDLTVEDMAAINHAGATTHYRHFKGIFKDE